MELTLKLPQQFSTESPEQMAQQIRQYAALGMYQSGILSIGAACELAGLDRFAFHDFLDRQGVETLTQTPDEFEAEWQKIWAQL